jgi:hypothetical protein
VPLRKIFAEQIQTVAGPRARETTRLSELFRWVGYAVGRRPAERLLHQMALPASDDTVLGRLKAESGVEDPDLKVRVQGDTRGAPTPSSRPLSSCKSWKVVEARRGFRVLLDTRGMD